MLRRWAVVAARGLLIFMASAGSAPAQDETGAGQEEATPPMAEPEPAPPPSFEPPAGIEAIEVTGERVNDANVQDEAQAITAFTGADLDRASIVNVDTLAFSVPGLHVGQSAQAPIITLRGIGTENASLTGEPGVAFHMDGVSLSRPAAARVAFFDLETLDVKRGPQGLLGGKNSTSGSINLVSRKPHDDYEVSGDVLAGNYDRIRWRGALNIPFGEAAATRIALYSEQRDGYLDNKYVSDSRDPFDADDFGYRWHLRFNPTETLELLFSHNYFKQGGNGPQADPVPILRNVWPAHLGVDAFGQPPEGYVVGCPDSPGTFSTVLPLASTCFKQRYRDELALPGRVSVAADGTVRTIPASQLPSRVIADVRRTGVPFQTTRLVDRETGKSPVQRGTFNPMPNNGQGETNFPNFDFWNPATEDSDPRSIYLDNTSGQDNRYWGWTTGLDWDVPRLPLFGETHLKLVGGFQNTETGIQQDFDATDVAVSYFTTEDEADQYSGDLQWSGAALAERLEWQVSLFHSHEEAERVLDAPGLNGNFNGSISSDQTTDNKSYGAGLHGRLAVTEALSFSLGGRYIKDRKSTWMLRDVPGLNPETRFRGCTGNLGAEGVPLHPSEENSNCSHTFRGTMWGTGLEWRPFGDDHLLYARLDRGYKSGGFRASTVGEYEPERIWAYAAGTKSEFFDQRLRVNLEGFFYNYQDMQLVIIDGLALRTENTDAKMYGWDLETQAVPIDGLLLSAVVSFLDTETTGQYLSLDPANADDYDRARLEARDIADANEAEAEGGLGYEKQPTCLSSRAGLAQYVECGTLTPFGGLDDFTGNELSRAPRWKTTLSAEYELPIGRFGSLTPRIQYTWQDDTYFRVFNRDFDLQEAYHLTNAKLVWTSPEQRWTVEAFVENIEDEAPKQNILVGPRQFGAAPLAWYGPPRFYGMQVGFKY
jgi:outer membrane receptor protein involved in Fe transport